MGPMYVPYTYMGQRGDIRIAAAGIRQFDRTCVARVLSAGTFFSTGAPRCFLFVSVLGKPNLN